MYIAIGSDGKRIIAKRGMNRDEEYTCPVCGGKVRYKSGEVNAPYFAHENLRDCPDDFNKPMTEWHKAWQNMFPLECQEVVISWNGETHRADVVFGDTVIEFQHSKISAEEFERRNKFYTGAGYRLIWIFDVREEFSRERISCTGNSWKRRGDYGDSFTWKYPWRIWGDWKPQNSECISIYFQITDIDEDDKQFSYLERVVWTNPDTETAWARFRTSLKICNYLELVQQLTQEYCKRKGAGSKGKENYGYLMDGRVVSADELRSYIKSEYPLTQVGGNASNDPKKGIGKCPNQHQKPHINANTCYLECYNCVAVVKTGKNSQYVYCNYHNSKNIVINPKWIQKIE